MAATKTIWTKTDTDEWTGDIGAHSVEIRRAKPQHWGGGIGLCEVRGAGHVWDATFMVGGVMSECELTRGLSVAAAKKAAAELLRAKIAAL